MRKKSQNLRYVGLVLKRGHVCVLFTRANHSPRSQVLQDATMWKRTTQQFSGLVILLTDMRFKLKEGTQKNIFESDIVIEFNHARR